MSESETLTKKSDAEDMINIEDEARNRDLNLAFEILCISISDRCPAIEDIRVADDLTSSLFKCFGEAVWTYINSEKVRIELEKNRGLSDPDLNPSDYSVPGKAYTKFQRIICIPQPDGSVKEIVLSKNSENNI